MYKITQLTAQYEVRVGPLPHVGANDDSIKAFLAIVFTTLGALAFLMLVIGGVRYVASQGDPQATAKAKGTIIYALIGLVVAISAVSIVSLVLRNF